MVGIKSIKPGEIKIINNWRDNWDNQLMILTFMFFGLIMGIVYSHLKSSVSSILYVFLIIVIIFMIFQFLVEEFILFDFNTNFWAIKKNFLFIPLRSYIGKISSIAHIVSVEQKKNVRMVKVFSAKNIEYSTALELWIRKKEDVNLKLGISEDSLSNEKSKFWNTYAFFEKKKIYRRDIFEKEIKDNHDLGIAIKQYFEKLETPIDFFIKNENQ